MSQKRTVLFLAIVMLVAIPCASESTFATTCTAHASADATSPTPIGTICGGSYSDTPSLNSVEECLQEASSSGSYKLQRRWNFNSVAAGTLTLTYNGWRGCNSNDDFQFGWTPTQGGTPITTISGAVINVCDPATGSASMGTFEANGGLDLTITDTTPSSDSQQDQVHLDWLEITTTPTDFCANTQSVSPGQVISGSLGNLCAQDGNEEAIQETTVSGKARLTATWAFPYVVQGNHTLCITGWRSLGNGNDTYQFGYRLGNSGPFQNISGAIVSDSESSSACYSFGSSTDDDEIDIAAWDTVSTDTGLSNLNLDQLVIHTDPICP
ncbi:MAG TPA: hypothetical protein VFC25_00895 [Verrucomicrobiae bacterium]|nr:hypothetical protein [Verrucomicrobiae bacterium]